MAATSWRQFGASRLPARVMSDPARLLRVRKTEKFLKLAAAQPDLDQLAGIYSPVAAASEKMLILLSSTYDPLDQRPAVHQVAGVDRHGRGAQQDLDCRSEMNYREARTPDTRFDILGLWVAGVLGHEC